MLHSVEYTTCSIHFSLYTQKLRVGRLRCTVHRIEHEFHPCNARVHVCRTDISTLLMGERYTKIIAFWVKQNFPSLFDTFDTIYAKNKYINSLLDHEINIKWVNSSTPRTCVCWSTPKNRGVRFYKMMFHHVCSISCMCIDDTNGVQMK